MDNDENKIKIVINTENQESEENNINSPFCEEFSGIIGKDLFKEEQKPPKGGIKIKETVLDNKISKKLKLKETKITSFIQSQKINELEKSLNITLTDETKEEKEFLKLRTFPEFDINEYDKIKKRVGKNLLNITNFLLNKQLKLNLSEINQNKKIGPLLPLTKLIENAYKYNPGSQNEMQQKYLRLKNYICNYRTIYGDGNCFYRGVMFRYIELLILNKKKDFIKLLILDMNKIYTNPETKLYLIFNNYKINYELIIQIMIIIYELVEQNNIIQAHQAFYKAIICSKNFDFLLIFYLRFILCEYIKVNENKLYMKNFPVLIGNLLPSIYEKDGIFDFNSFYNNYLLKMFIPAEKIIVYLTPFVLGINLEIVLFDDNEDDVVKKFIFNEEDNDNDVIKKNLEDVRQNIFLINIMYHYENVFNYFDNKNFNEVYQYYRNDLNPIFIKEDETMKNLYIKIKNGNKNNNKNNSNDNKNNFQQKNEINIKKVENTNKNNINNNINNNYNHDQNNNNQNNKLCIICSKVIYIQNKTIKDICQTCLFRETFLQIKKYYIDYIKLIQTKINQNTIDDLYNFFMNKIKVNIYEKSLNINQIIEEMEFYNKKISYVNQLMSQLKQSICLYCYKDTNKSKLYQLPCGCSFCSVLHLENFFKNIVTNKLTYNFRCICALEYKPYQVLELCNYLYKNKIYKSNDNYEKHLNSIFKNFCCKCGKNKNKIYAISVDNIITNFHNICDECYKGNNIHNKTLYCFICNKTHNYI